MYSETCPIALQAGYLPFLSTFNDIYPDVGGNVTEERVFLKNNFKGPINRENSFWKIMY